jgi:hypothetical protein
MFICPFKECYSASSRLTRVPNITQPSDHHLHAALFKLIAPGDDGLKRRKVSRLYQ